MSKTSWVWRRVLHVCVAFLTWDNLTHNLSGSLCFMMFLFFMFQDAVTSWNTEETDEIVEISE